MKATSKLLFLLILLFSTMAAYSQCETYLQKAESLFAQKKYCDAKKQYENYKECKPNVSDIDIKIAECDRLCKELPPQLPPLPELKEEKIYYNENWQGCSQYQAKYYRVVKYDKDGKPVGKIYDYFITGELQGENDGAIYIDKINDRNSKFTGYTISYYKNGVKANETQFDKDGNVVSVKNWDENGNLKVPRTKTAIGIGSFSGYKNNETETSIRNAFVQDGRFIVSNVKNTYSYGGNQQTAADVDYIVSGTCTLIQQARTETHYISIPATKWTSAQNIPQTNNIPEIVNVDLTLTNSKGEIVVSSTYNLNNIDRIAGNIFPIKMYVNQVKGEKIGIDNSGGGKFFDGDICKVYEEYDNGNKSYLGALKIGKTYDDCKITDGKKEINNRFKEGAKLIVVR